MRSKCKIIPTFCTILVNLVEELRNCWYILISRRISILISNPKLSIGVHKILTCVFLPSPPSSAWPWLITVSFFLHISCCYVSPCSPRHFLAKLASIPWVSNSEGSHMPCCPLLVSKDNLRFFKLMPIFERYFLWKLFIKFLKNYINIMWWFYL